MILISHRGNIDGKFVSLENKPEYIDTSIFEGYDVEIDVWYINDNFYLGHDNPQYEVNLEWFLNRIKNLWIHCKNVDCMVFFNNLENKFNYFWHQDDTVTLTSLGFIWSFPGNQPIKNSISVLPEIKNEETKGCYGICSDFIKKYK